MLGLLQQLNAKQKEAVLQTEGPVLILAGAGSGKTRTLTHRVAYLIKNKKNNPQNILAVTFTNKAAQEMAERIKRLLGLPLEMNVYSSLDLPTMGTFHSICVRILRREIEHIGYERNFVIYDDQDQKTLIKKIMKDLDVSDKEIKPNVILSVISSAKNQLQGASDYEEMVGSYKEELIAKCFYRYERELKRVDALDFDDLIMKTVEIFEIMPKILNKYQKLWKYIMVDEYQDTNKAQYRLLKMLTQKHQNICVVGDDYQSVYRWRGADISNILNFEKDYPNTKTILLEQNYRSTQTILEVADCVIKNNKKQKHKKLWTENSVGKLVTLFQAYDEKEEAGFVVKEILRLQAEEKIKLNNFAILYRTNAQSRALEEAFMKVGVPYKIIGGLKFYQRKEIKDILAYLYFINNSKDKISFTRIINEPKRGLGGKTVEKILSLVNKYDYNILITLQNLKTEKYQGSVRLPDNKIRDLEKFANLIQRFKKYSQKNTVKKIIEKVYEDSGYKLMLDKMGDEGLVRQENILELLTVAEEYDEPEIKTSDQVVGFEFSQVSSLQRFLEDVALVSQTDRDLDVQEAVPLMTVHSAKGLEYKVVFVVGMEEGLFPHSRASIDSQEMEEERRLCYVAITRAMERLYFVYTNTRNIYGSSQISIKSRFIDEVDKKFLEMKVSELLNSNSEEYNSFFYEKNDEDGWEDSFDSEFSDRWEKVINLDGEESDCFEENGRWQEGDKVRHNIFGKGIVIGMDEKTISIVFENIGIKKLAKKIVRLEKIS